MTQPVDAVLIVGTRLLIPSVADFAKRLCGAVRETPEGLAVWVSKDPPSLSGTFRSLINFEYLGDCDDSASTLSQ